MTDHDHHRNGQSPSGEQSQRDTGDGQRNEVAGSGDEERVEQSMLEEEAEEADEASQEVEDSHGQGGDHGAHGHEDQPGKDHGGHGGMHAGHEQMFRRRFFVSTALSISVLLYSETMQDWLGFTVPAFTGSELIVPVFSVIVFLYGGLPFLRMAVPEICEWSPGMMTLISMAITVAFVYSMATILVGW